MSDCLDAAAVRAKVDGAVAGALKFEGDWLDGPKFDYAAADLAAALVGAGRGLTALDLYGNNLGADGMASLSEALASGCCPVLASLDVGYTELGADGMASLSGVLASGCCPLLLASLDVRQTSNGADGMASLSEALASGCCPLLASLSVHYNELGADGMASGCCPVLASLDVGFNKLTRFPEALCAVASLEELSFGGNDIDRVPLGLLHLTRLAEAEYPRQPPAAAGDGAARRQPRQHRRAVRLPARQYAHQAVPTSPCVPAGISLSDRLPL